MAGEGRPHPRTLWSDESATTGFPQIPSAPARETIKDELLSGFTRHHVAYEKCPADATLTEVWHIPSSTTGTSTIESLGDGGTSLATGSAQLTGSALQALRLRTINRVAKRRIVSQT
jgi:hypothetical protein